MDAAELKNKSAVRFILVLRLLHLVNNQPVIVYKNAFSLPYDHDGGGGEEEKNRFYTLAAEQNRTEYQEKENVQEECN